MMKLEVGKLYFRRDHFGPVTIIEKITDDRYLSDMGQNGEYYHYTKASGNACIYLENGEWLNANDIQGGHAKDIISEAPTPKKAAQ